METITTQNRKPLPFLSFSQNALGASRRTNLTVTGSSQAQDLTGGETTPKEFMMTTDTLTAVHLSFDTSATAVTLTNATFFVEAGKPFFFKVPGSDGTNDCYMTRIQVSASGNMTLIQLNE